MVRTSQSIRVLGPATSPTRWRWSRTDPVTNVFADYRTRITQLDTRWLGGEMWGYFEDDRLVSMCHVGANLVPVNATPAACEAFVERATRTGPRSSTIVGPARRRRAAVGRARGALAAPSRLPLGPAAPGRDARPRRSSATRWCGVRRRRRGTSSTRRAWRCTPRRSASRPEIDGGKDLYRARVNQLIGRGWSFSRIEDGRVVFKAEVACATPSACQIQGVYVDPELRGQGLAAAGMATVVETCLREIAPAVSLYVNAHNTPARAAYKRAGFEQTGTFATLMF